MHPRWRDLIVPDDSETEIDDGVPPLEVKVVNTKETKKEISIYDSVDNEHYDNMMITDEEIEEFENGDPQG